MQVQLHTVATPPLVVFVPEPGSRGSSPTLWPVSCTNGTNGAKELPRLHGSHRAGRRSPLTPAGASNDPGFPKQWNLEKIGAETAWARTTGAKVRVGIVDAGIDLGHEDLAGRVVAATSCLKSQGDPAKCEGSAQDDIGHGTHVAGIIAANRDNGVGVAGVAPDAELVVAKVADSGGGISIEDANAGIRWVVDHGAKVVNLSLGDLIFVRTAAFGTRLSEGIEYAWSKGAVPVIASGNSDLFGAGDRQPGLRRHRRPRRRRHGPRRPRR